jgi:hypothetical protein
MLGVLLAAAITTQAPPLVQDPILTPGATNPAITQENIATTICRPGGYTNGADASGSKVRNTTPAVKRAVYEEYHIDKAGEGAPYEVDHLISLELGGADEKANLWPQSYVTLVWNAHVKDHLENRLHKLVCNGTITLLEAQTAIRTDWTAAYTKYVDPTYPSQLKPAE